MARSSTPRQRLRRSRRRTSQKQDTCTAVSLARLQRHSNRRQSRGHLLVHYLYCSTTTNTPFCPPSRWWYLPGERFKLCVRQKKILPIRTAPHLGKRCNRLGHTAKQPLHLSPYTSASNPSTELDKKIWVPKPFCLSADVLTTGARDQNTAASIGVFVLRPTSAAHYDNPSAPFLHHQRLLPVESRPSRRASFVFTRHQDHLLGLASC